MKHKKIADNCVFCQKDYLGYGKKFCSPRCKGAWQKVNLKGPKNPNWRGGSGTISYCRICKQRISPYHNYCHKCSGRVMSKSPKYRTKYKNRIKRCQNCKKFLPWINTAPRQKFCGKNCCDHWFKKIKLGKGKIGYWNGKTGAKAPSWKGGITLLHRGLRHTSEYQRWRKAVFARDRYTCQSCHKQDSRLEADHILPFAKYPSHRLDIDNGRTLCFTCHRQTPTYGNRKTLKALRDSGLEDAKQWSWKLSSEKLLRALE